MTNADSTHSPPSGAAAGIRTVDVHAHAIVGEVEAVVAGHPRWPRSRLSTCGATASSQALSPAGWWVSASRSSPVLTGA